MAYNNLMRQKTYVTASEIGEFIYCKRAWWLRQKGFLETTDAMRRGNSEHNRLGQIVFRHKILFALALLLIGLGVLGFVLYFAVQNFLL